MVSVGEEDGEEVLLSVSDREAVLDCVTEGVADLEGGIL